ncbi:MAG: M48 family metallopeptidase [Acidobacteriia bacterium]|nr:M48 family metallopeptidase [Terriglobia bacterium]
MKKLTLVLSAPALVLALALCSNPAFARAQQSSSATTAAQQQPAPPATPAASPEQAAQKITAYTLPPDRYKKARDLSRINFRFAIISFLYGLIVLWLVLAWRIAPKYRTWAEKASSNRFVQALIFAPLLVLTVDILELPTGIYDNWVERKYGISVQGWRSWSWDWTKGELISAILGIILVSLLYWVIRKSPRRWWFYFWLTSLPIIVLLIFLQPLIIDPLFHKFEPLAKKDPALTASLEQLVQRAGQDIPPERMFWMGASEKSTALNAYVTGFGASKRIVVYDTTIVKMTTPQIVYVAGHETGHYVLRHIPKQIAFTAAAFFIFLYLGYRCIGWLLARRGVKWEIRGADDMASLPALLILLSIFGFVANPVTSAISRHYEHQADQYGLEVTHGLTPDSGQVAAQAFNTLGDVDLADPEPNPVNVFLFYNHPSIPDRIQFSLTYDPWASGGHGEFVP